MNVTYDILQLLSRCHTRCMALAGWSVGRSGLGDMDERFPPLHSSPNFFLTGGSFIVLLVRTLLGHALLSNCTLKQQQQQQRTPCHLTSIHPFTRKSQSKQQSTLMDGYGWYGSWNRRRDLNIIHVPGRHELFIGLSSCDFQTPWRVGGVMRRD